MAEILPFQPAFAADFRRINLAWLAQYFTVEPLDLVYLEDPQGKILDPGGDVFFAVEDGMVLGTCAAIPHAPGVLELAKFAVVPAAQGKGLGTALAQAVLDFARRRGDHTVMLLSNHRLTAALRIYERLGFVRLPFPEPSPYADADVYMEVAV
ncbi:MAG: GNAT family N-acetyltransferase [Gemmatimonadetes bacterium]|nr:GNAT family N-acetyltransferase [Gemmatimonadota bacterium]MBK9066489.1 GNAT family N-acetyltransferase [Gemmatimonadota bacterium]